jgi:hypothetical protein
MIHLGHRRDGSKRRQPRHTVNSDQFFHVCINYHRKLDATTFEFHEPQKFVVSQLRRLEQSTRFRKHFYYLYSKNDHTITYRKIQRLCTFQRACLRSSTIGDVIRSTCTNFYVPNLMDFRIRNCAWTRTFRHQLPLCPTGSSLTGSWPCSINLIAQKRKSPKAESSKTNTSKRRS